MSATAKHDFLFKIVLVGNSVKSIYNLHKSNELYFASKGCWQI